MVGNSVGIYKVELLVSRYQRDETLGGSEDLYYLVCLVSRLTDKRLLVLFFECSEHSVCLSLCC